MPVAGDDGLSALLLIEQIGADRTGPPGSGAFPPCSVSCCAVAGSSCARARAEAAITGSGLAT
ncbi:hypothetical protein [Aeromonas diversa]|uniref:hypothetical protein n=1 Tax=Aeromonas diversa TaxID=502790 RepID=UPI001267B341|nr:hypothetical protein [Aeromonas diversa]